MKTKTREFEEIKQSEKTEAIAIPKSILDEVWEKWFYVYDIVYRIYFNFDGDLCNNFVNL